MKEILVDYHWMESGRKATDFQTNMQQLISMTNSKKYYDIETDEIVTVRQLTAEYQLLKADGDTEAENFEQYLINCLAGNNGTLITMDQRLKEIADELEEEY